MVTEKVTTKVGGKHKAEKTLPSSPIGVFDSGVGGLTVLSQIMGQLPKEDMLYFADTARVPYGGRSAQEIIKINREIIPFLINQGAKMIIMACGTSSAIAYPVVSEEYPIEMINLIDPGSRAAVLASKEKKIGIIATEGTVRSHAFQERIKELSEKAEVHAVGCPLFVPLIEGGFIEGEEIKRVAKEYLKPLLEKGIDALILGCTHYPHITKVLQSIMGPKVVLIDPAEQAVADAKKMLKSSGTLKTETIPAKYQFFVSGSVVQFQDLGSRLLGKPIVGAKSAKLG